MTDTTPKKPKTLYFRHGDRGLCVVYTLDRAEDGTGLLTMGCSINNPMGYVVEPMGRANVKSLRATNRSIVFGAFVTKRPGDCFKKKEGREIAMKRFEIARETQGADPTPWYGVQTEVQVESPWTSGPNPDTDRTIIARVLQAHPDTPRSVRNHLDLCALVRISALGEVIGAITDVSVSSVSNVT